MLPARPEPQPSPIIRFIKAAVPGLLWSGVRLMAPFFGSALIGYWIALDRYPRSLVALACVIAFTAVVWGMVGIEWLLDRLRMKNMLDYTKPLYRRTSGTAEITFGIALTNKSRRLLEVKLDRARTRIGTATSANLQGEIFSYRVPPDGRANFFDVPIALPLPAASSVRAILEFDLRYGQPGWLRHHLTVRKVIVIDFNPDGEIAGSHEYDLA